MLIPQKTSGLTQVLPVDQFREALDAVYLAPNAGTGSQKCLVCLVLAIGMALSPRPEPSPSVGHDPARDRHIRADALYQQAESLANARSSRQYGGFEAIQAFCLMAMYQMIMSRFNSAYFQIGEKTISSAKIGVADGHRRSGGSNRFDLWPRPNR
jgi:hypothetical protein